MYKSSQLRSALETVGMRVQSLRLNNFDRWCGNNEGEPPPPQRCGIALVVTVLMIYRTDTALMIYRFVWAGWGLVQFDDVRPGRAPNIASGFSLINIQGVSKLLLSTSAYVTIGHAIITTRPPIENYDRPTDFPINQQTDVRVHGEVRYFL